MAANVDRGRERELKFEVDEAFVVPDLDGWVPGDRSEVVLTVEYWDTADLRLLRWGHSLRYRRSSDGSEDGWTLKLKSASPGGAAKGASRDELDVTGPPDVPPAELRALVAAFVRRGHLARQATLVTVRRSMVFGREDHAARYELADDLVTSRIGPKAGPTFRQVEVEAVGSPSTDGAKGVRADEVDANEVDADLDELARALEAAGAGAAGSTPKVALVLADRLGGPEVAARSLDHRGATIADLVGASLAAGLRRLVLHDPYVRLGDDPEAVHQARVATRRLRSDLRTLAPLLQAGPVARWRSELSWLGALLGSVRDLDVLESRLARDVELITEAELGADAGGEVGHGSLPTGVAELLDGVRSEREVRRAVLGDVLASPRYLALLDELVPAVAAPPFAIGVDPDERASPVAARLTRHAWRRVRRGVPDRPDEASDAALHELRKRAKQARYAAELADGVLRGGLAELAVRLGDLQDGLGELQDTVSAANWLAEPARRSSGDAAFFAGRLLERQLRARAEARAAWWDVWRPAERKSLRRAL